MYNGIAASEGIAIGKVLLLEKQEPVIDRSRIDESMVDIEIRRFFDALELSKGQLRDLQRLSNKVTREVLETHIMILEDPDFVDSVIQKIQSNRQDSVSAVFDTIEFFVGLLDNAGDAYMRERSVDMRDVSHRVMMNLEGKEIPSLLSLKEDVILVARDITPSDTAQMDKGKVLGFLTDTGGKTSHAAIVARTLGIPAILGMSNITKRLKNGDFICFDGEEGVLCLNPSQEVVEKYRQKKERLEREAALLSVYKDKPSVTLDGRSVEIAANIGVPEDALSAKSYGAEGVGLFRTEFLYMDRKGLPGEEEQLEAYKTVLETMGPRPVIIRTLDIGGDKNLPYLNFPQEMNPFLGYRAIRVGLDQRDLFKTQLRALLRASVYGKLRIMYPMVCSVEEVVSANDLLEECRRELTREGHAFSRDLEVGVMIEVPSAAICADLIAPEVDFFSVGTNDLTQYTCAVDRMNEKVSSLYNPFNPAVLKLVQHVIDVAHAHGLWCGVCGETAGDKRLIPLYLGMGLDEFSMNPRTVPKARKLIAHLSYAQMQEMAEEVLRMRFSEEIRAYLEARVLF